MKKRVLHAIACIIYIIILSGLAAGGVRQNLSAGIMNASEQKDLALQDIICKAQENALGKMQIHQIEDLPDYDTAEEMRDYFLEKHPSSDNYEVYPPEEGAEGVEELYLIEEAGVTYIYFTRMGESYMALSKSDSDYSLIRKIRTSSWEYYDYISRWQKSEGRMQWYNFSNGVVTLEWDNGDGVLLWAECKAIPSDDPELKTWNKVEVSVYHKGEKEPFQVFETLEFYSESGEPYIYLTDINMDDYFDIEVNRCYFSRYSYVDDYIWSTSNQTFVEAPSEVLRFTSRERDEKRRIVYIYDYYGSNYSKEYAYQWENEMDIRLVGLLETADASGGTGDAMSFKILKYDKEEVERVILDYVTEEIWELEDFATALYYENVLEELTIEDKDTGVLYQLYYTQTEENEGHLYVIDEELQPVNKLEWESHGAYSGMVWTVDENGIAKLQILDENGNRKEYGVEELLGK